MITLYNKPTYLIDGTRLVPADEYSPEKPLEKGFGRISDAILDAHSKGGEDGGLHIKFDALTSHDITYVNIIQTARISGLDRFPVPYVLTNCHNSLCAVGGTINEDDHRFGMSAAVKYGGEFVPPHIAVIHQYMREKYAGCGKMILGSDSHTRYGALGTLAVGEGGGELVKQILGKTYDIARPEVVAVCLTGTPKCGVGPQDIALAIIKAVFASGAVKNKIMEFVGDGISALSVEYRMGIDVMTTETTCLSSVWRTDDKVKRYLSVHGRESDYSPLEPKSVALYDSALCVDLSAVECMAALPFHPSNAFTVRELNENLSDILASCDKGLAKCVIDGRLFARQAVIAGCAGGSYVNLAAAADILDAADIKCGSELSLYPASQPIYAALIKNGIASRLMSAGGVLKTAFCGPCFGAGDIPADGSLSVRHTTRNFPNREGSKPNDSQSAFVALMDARSVAATYANGGRLTPATDYAIAEHDDSDEFDDSSYNKRVYHGYNNAKPERALELGPNIADFPEMKPLSDNLLLFVASALRDSVTTTDELIPSGETSSYRSNPVKLSSFALSRRDPEYVSRTKNPPDISGLADIIKGFTMQNTDYASLVVAVCPGDGSAREQAASCQRVLGGRANIASRYATKRYRSNLINWGMLPFEFEDTTLFNVGDVVYIPDIKEALKSGADSVAATLVSGGKVSEVTLRLPSLSARERELILSGCLANFYKDNR